MEGLGGLWKASWGVLEPSEGVLEASWGILGPFEGVLRRLRGVLRRFEASSRPPGGEGRAGSTPALAVLGGSLESSKRIFCSESRMLRGFQLRG